MTQEEAFRDGLITSTELKSQAVNLLYGFKNNRVLLGQGISPSTGTRNPLFLKNADRATHFHVMGRSGGGKSRLLEFLIRQDIKRGHGVCVIDPHGELYWNILRYIIRHCDESILSRLYIINPSQDDYLIHFNPFAMSNGFVQTNIDNFISFLEKIWGHSLAETPAIKDAISYIFYVSHLAGLSILKIRELFFSPEYREEFFHSFIQKCDKVPRHIYAYWQKIVDDPSRNNLLGVTGAHSRIDYILSSPAIQLMTLRGPSIHLDEVIDNNGIVLVNLALSPVFSVHDQRMYGTLLLNEIVRLFSSRSSSFMYAGDKELKSSFSPFFLYLDEFQFFISKDISEIITGGRKFGLHLTVANQTFAQIPVELLSVVKDIATNKAYFSVKDIETAIHIWQQTGIYSPRIKDTVRRLYNLNEGYNIVEDESYSYDYRGMPRKSVSNHYLSRSSIHEDVHHNYFTPQELDLIEGKKIQNMEKRHFLLHSDGLKEGIVLQTEWCFDVNCPVSRIRDFHRTLYERFPDRYSPYSALETELNNILYNYNKEGTIIPGPDIPPEIKDEVYDHGSPFNQITTQ